MAYFIIATMCALVFLVSGLHVKNALTPVDTSSMTAAVYDYEAYCNEEEYLDVGTLYDGSIPAQISASEHPSPLVRDLSENTDPRFHTLRRGQTLHSILRPQHVSAREIFLLGKALRPQIHARDLTAGTLYQFELQNVSKDVQFIKSFTIKKSDPNRIPILYRVHRTNSDPENASFKLEVLQPDIRFETTTISLVVKDSLYQTFSQIPFGNDLMQRLMGIFVWTMRMPQEVLNGDSIDILVNKKFALDTFIGYGKILSARYQQSHRSFFATFFTAGDKKIQGYFDEKGNSLEREFAYSPVFETTATSNQKWRYHPIRKRRIRHNGIDYRGSIGTPFYAIADGEIIEKRFDKNVGNMIRIRHKYGVHSEYFHAHELIKELRVGTHVLRNQQLGTIGKTGRLCTGPHLHLGLYKIRNGRKQFISLTALRNTLKPEPSISQEYLSEFQDHFAQHIALLEGEEAPQPLVTIHKQEAVATR